MGLDISYYSNVKRERDINQNEDYETDSNACFYPNPEYPERADGLTEGYYSVESGSGFRAGSYGSYNKWRNSLAQIAGYGSAENAWKQGAGGRTSGLFWELINFSDCEGLIGPVTSAKLAADFARYQHVADDHADSYFADRYVEWRLAFETAANNGAVSFH
jgi:hypothetical protein